MQRITDRDQLRTMRVHDSPEPVAKFARLAADHACSILLPVLTGRAATITAAALQRITAEAEAPS